MAVNHPSRPEQRDDEDFVEYLGRLADFWTNAPPPAPEGFELLECGATPRHWPEYAITDDTFYPGHCLRCQLDSVSRDNRRLRCEAEHRRWKSWRIWSRIASRLYVLGVTSSGGGTSYGRCEFCGIGRQQIAPHWRGKRVYILGKYREWWVCLLKRRHRYAPLRGNFGDLCAKCLPCPECGSQDPMHYVCEAN